MPFKEKMLPMRFEKKDLKFLFPCAIFLGICSLSLYFNLKVDIAASGLEVGLFIKKYNIALRKQNKQVFWEQADEKYAVYNLDTIRTQEDSSAFIELKDGTKLQIEENSLIIIDYTDDSVTVDVAHGNLSAKKNKKDASDSQLKIKSAEQTIALNDGELQIQKKLGQKKIEIAVNRGNVQLSSADGQEKEIKENQRLKIDTAGELTVDTIPFSLVSPNNGEHVIANKKDQRINFKWKNNSSSSVASKAKELSIYLQVSKQQNFKRLISNTQTNKDSAALSLSFGRYYWRVVAKKGNKNIHSSSIYKIDISKAQSVSLQAPFNNQKFSYTRKPSLINFSWSEHKLATAYKIQIANDRKFNNIIEEKIIRNRQIAFALKEGKYYWKVILQSSFKAAEKPTRTNTFQVNKDTIKGLEIKLIAANKKNIWKKNFIEKGIHFSWEAHPEFNYMELQISSQRNFKKIVSSKKLNSNVYHFRDKLPSGTYYWRVRGLEPKIAPSKKIGILKIIDYIKLNVQLNSPRNKTILYEHEVNKTGIAFSWQKSKIKVNYNFALATDYKFRKIVKKAMLNDNSFSIAKLKAGNYFWRVALLNKDSKKRLGISRLSNFKIAKTAKFELLDGTTIWGTAIGIQKGKIKIKTSKGTVKVDLQNLQNLIY